MTIDAVEARKSLVDRNHHLPRERAAQGVEARKSLVDRNAFICRLIPGRVVEARKSLVDRNTVRLPSGRKLFCRGSQEPRGSKSDLDAFTAGEYQSRLARASWIEISPAVLMA